MSALGHLGDYSLGVKKHIPPPRRICSGSVLQIQWTYKNQRGLLCPNLQGYIYGKIFVKV